MKKLVFNIAILICVIFTSCSDDDSVNIVSLNTFGTKFCRNDVVKVFVSAELSDDTDVSYEWGCDGGSMTNPQGLFENVWRYASTIASPFITNICIITEFGRNKYFHHIVTAKLRAKSVQ